jgi:uncharacterized protein (TIGR04255 family)
MLVKKEQPMAINEIFPNPTAKAVVFQVKFPNLFMMESLIGEFQMRIMSKFPESALLLRRGVLFTELGAKDEVPEKLKEGLETKKIWNFRSEDGGVEMNVLTDSLDISSNAHKTYNNAGSPRRFREVIEFAVSNFLAVTHLSLLTRIGLRYVDSFPPPTKDDAAFSSWYKTTFPIGRFSIKDAEQMEFVCVVKRGDYSLRYAESLSTGDDKQLKYTQDYDAFATRVKSADYLPVIDQLHELLIAEFEQSINSPVYEHMRRPG